MYSAAVFKNSKITLHDDIIHTGNKDNLLRQLRDLECIQEGLAFLRKRVRMLGEKVQLNACIHRYTDTGYL